MPIIITSTAKILLLLLSLALSNLVFSAWYLDRDNSMEAINLNDDSVNAKVGRAMGIVMNYGYKSDSIQVCEGVYLTAGHSLLNENLQFDKSKIRIYTYPYVHKKYMKVAEIISPYSKSFNIKKDYLDFAFIKVKKSFSEEYIEVLNIHPNEIAGLKNSKNIDIDLYRAKSTSKIKPMLIEGKFGIDWNNKNLDSNKNLFKTPVRVNSCKLGISFDNGQSTSDCPSEAGTSGAPFISKINNNPYVVGLLTGGQDRNINDFDQTIEGTVMLNTSPICEYYKKACGKPCAELNKNSLMLSSQ